MSAYLDTKTGEYPRHIGDLYLLGYKDSDNFPKNWVMVNPTVMPEFSHNQIVKEIAPQFVNGQWVQCWEVVTLTDEELADLEIKRQSIDKLFEKNIE